MAVSKGAKWGTEWVTTGRKCRAKQPVPNNRKMAPVATQLLHGVQAGVV